MDIIDPTTNKTVTWINNFNGLARFESKKALSALEVKEQKPVVCLSIPYTSSDENKLITNEALLVEFIRYYSLLGFRVVVYDRDSKNKNTLKTSSYAKARNITLDFVYYNYTILGLLDPSTAGLRYDFDKYVLRNREITNWDKTLTNTHCRFELKTSPQQTQNVLVVDFDEFMYCPEAEPTFSAQRKHVHSMIRHHEYMKFGQIGFPQRWIMTRTDNPKQCMKEQASKGESVFYCFGPYKHLVGGFDMKSMHLGHKCVATDFHQSCTHPGARNINCICQTYNQN